jgi:hypothetical protein
VKRVIFWFILVVVAGGGVLYLGMVTIEPGFFGIANSSITGLVDKPLESGAFHWFWQRLVPGTFFLNTIEKKPKFVDFQASFAMPGSENLREFGGFDIALRVEVEYFITFESAKLLLERGILDSFHSLFQKELETLVEGTVSSYVLGDLLATPSSPGPSGERSTAGHETFDSLREDLRKKIAAHAGQYLLGDARVGVVLTRVPELKIYAEAIGGYSRYVEFIYARKEEEFKQGLEMENRKQLQELEFGRLTKFGDLLSRYPVLLKLLYIEKFGEKADVVVIPGDPDTGFPKMLEQLSAVEEQRREPAPGAQRGEAGANNETVPAGGGNGSGSVRSKRWYDGLIFWKKRGDR